MANRIRLLIQEAKTAFERNDIRTARRKALEASVGAQNAKDERMLYRNEAITDTDLADWFITIATLFYQLGNHITAAKCFYTATLFDANWTEEKHCTISDDLKTAIIFACYHSPDGHTSINCLKFSKLLTDVETLAQEAESRAKEMNKRPKEAMSLALYRVCLKITEDLIQYEDLMWILFNQSTTAATKTIDRYKRIARCLLNMGHRKAVQSVCLYILKDLTDYDDADAFELWSRSLYLSNNYEVALNKVDMALKYAKTSENIERLNTLQKEIQSKIPTPVVDHKPDHSWLGDTCVKRGALSKAAPLSNIVTRKAKKSKTRHRRPKARERASGNNLPPQITSVTSLTTHALSRELCSLQKADATITSSNRKEKYPFPNKCVNKLQSDTGHEVNGSGKSSLNSACFNVSDLDASLTDVSIDSETDEDVGKSVFLSSESTQTVTDEGDEQQEVNENNNISFYEQTCRMYDGQEWLSNNSECDASDEKLTACGLRLNASYLHRFKENEKWKPFYDSFLHEEKIRERFLQRPDIYKRCIIQIQGSHVSNCHPIESKDAGLVIEISGRQKAGQTYNEDEVVVELLDKPHENKDRRYGKVVGILNRNRYKDIAHPVFICTLDEMDTHLVRPLCKTVPKIRILNKIIRNNYFKYRRYKVEVYTYHHKSQTLSEDPKVIDVNPGDREKYVFLVAMIGWGPKSIYPIGAVIKMLKYGDTIQRGLSVLDLKHKVPSVYNRQTYEGVKTIQSQYDGDQCFTDQHDRRDLCNLKTFTIDPPGSQDLDDAVSIERINDGYRVGVHIADVSAYVRKDDPIDIEACERAVTYYPTIRRRPRNMLPEPLSSDLCSLHPGKQKLALSVFFILTENGRPLQMEGRNYEIVRSVIQSKQRFTYSEVQAIINDPSSTNNSQPLQNEIMSLYRLAKMIRQRRLGNAMFALDIESDEELSEDSISETLEAHFLVEEFMIMTNKKVAEVLVKAYPECTPIRTQPPPTKESMEYFLKKDSGYIDALVRLQDKVICDSVPPNVEHIRGDKSGKCIMLSKILWETFTKDPEKAMNLMKMDDLYPIQNVVYQHWLHIQERAEYQCSGGLDCSQSKKHFSLNMFPYTHFTSPIRRYNDLIIHRLLIAQMNRQQSPYSKTEIERICVHVNATMKRARAYERECKSLQQAVHLKSEPQMVRCFVDESTERGVSLCAPELESVRGRQRQLPFNLLDMSRKPELIEDNATKYDKVIAVWRKRIYDTTGVSSQPPIRGDMNTVVLDPHPDDVLIPLSSWARMLKCVLDGRKDDLKRTIKSISRTVRTTENGLTDVSTESLDPLNIQPNTVFSLTFSHGQTLKGQMASVPRKGLLSPRPVLYNMTGNVKLCLLHMDDPVLHLSRYTTKPTSNKYNNANNYVSTWLPIILMEAADGAVTNEECCIINNVQIKFDAERKGKFALPLTFCEIRNIDFSGIEDEDVDNSEPKSYDWLCLKFISRKYNQDVKQSHLNAHSKLNAVWVGHAEITRVKRKVVKNDPCKSKISISLTLHEKSPVLSQEAKQPGSRFSVEVLCKSEVDRRTERYIKRLPFAERASVAMKIALNQDKMHSLDKGHAHLSQLIERDLCIVSSDSAPLPKNNKKQQEAIDKALTHRFSLIQGPPGTGKSYTGIKLMCLFDKINYIKHKEGGKRHQVLFCGPSNKSVDLVARWMIQKLGEKTPKFLRVYGRLIEAMDYPIPGRTFLSRRSMHNIKADQELKEVSLHHLIRKKGGKNAAEIIAFDRKFKANKYAPDPANCKRYQHLIREASIETIRKYDVILCTTAVGSNPKVLEAASVFQVIVDEAGMCPEPQCLVPILATKAEQVVLIGDHKQLRPIVMCKEAAELGLDTSLFERYTKNRRIPFTMLEKQYRMNPELCRFPSKQFYDGKLITGNGPWNKDVIHMWPTQSDLGGNIIEYPHVLIHVEGEENILTVSTDEGNEHSRSNQQEIDIVVKVYEYLIDTQKLSTWQINVMSQYNAQVSEIKRRLEAKHFRNSKVNTVVSSQGGEWDYVIFSTVRSLPTYKIENDPTIGWAKQNLGFITDKNQINVALTRARKGIIIIGNRNLLVCDEVWKCLIFDYEKCGCVKSPEEFPPRKTGRINKGHKNHNKQR